MTPACVAYRSACHAVRFAMDRAGLVGADGATHCGAFDVTFMASLPNMVCMAPSNESELIHMVATSGTLLLLTAAADV